MEQKLSLEQLHHIELEILQEFHNFCEEHALTYYLIGGTLLGAIRHKGFIPWDDDIDVVMPRNDYEKFLTLFEHDNKISHLKLAFLGHTPNYYCPTAKVFDSRFEMHESNIRITCPLGPWIDVFPLDNMSDDYRAAVALFKKISFWNHLKCGKTLLHNKKTFKERIKKLISKCLFCIPLSYILEKINTTSRYYASNSFTKYVCVVTVGTYGLKEIMPREWFEKRELHVFEDRKFYIPTQYHNILTNLYGDYMTPRKPAYVHFDMGNEKSEDRKENKN